MFEPVPTIPESVSNSVTNHRCRDSTQRNVLEQATDRATFLPPESCFHAVNNTQRVRLSRMKWKYQTLPVVPIGHAAPDRHTVRQEKRKQYFREKRIRELAPTQYISQIKVG